MTGLRRPREGCLHTYTVQEFQGYYTCKYTLLLIPVFKSHVFGVQNILMGHRKEEREIFRQGLQSNMFYSFSRVRSSVGYFR